MTRDDLRAIVVSTLGRFVPEMDPATLTPAVPLRDQLDLDSMDFLNFLIALHERLSVDIPEADYGQLASVDAIVEYLGARLPGTSQG